MKELLFQILQAVIIAVIPIVSAYSIKWIKQAAEEAKASADSEKIQGYITEIANAISDAVAATSQTFVDELKKNGTFTMEAQKEAAQKALNACLASISPAATAFIQETYGDLTEYLSNKIEAEVGDPDHACAPGNGEHRGHDRYCSKHSGGHRCDDCTDGHQAARRGAEAARTGLSQKRLAPSCGETRGRGLIFLPQNREKSTMRHTKIQHSPQSSPFWGKSFAFWLTLPQIGAIIKSQSRKTKDISPKWVRGQNRMWTAPPSLRASSGKRNAKGNLGTEKGTLRRKL